MKKNIILLLLIGLNGLFSKEIPEGIFDIKWGESYQTVNKKILTRQNISYKDSSSDKFGTINMIYQGGQISDYNVMYWQFSFLENKLFSIDVFFKCKKNSTDMSLIREISRLIETKYEKVTTFTQAFFNNEYTDDEKYSSIMSRDGSFGYEWFFDKYLNNTGLIKGTVKPEEYSFNYKYTIEVGFSNDEDFEGLIFINYSNNVIYNIWHEKFNKMIKKKQQIKAKDF